MTDETTIDNITFRNVRFAYDGEPVFEGLNWSAERGDHLVLKGESGSGKSTALRLLLGFHVPTGGSIDIITGADESISPSEFRSYVAWLPQEPDPGEGTVKEVLDRLFSFRRNAGVRPETDSIRSRMKQLSLDDALYNRAVSSLSTGQRQRVGALICSLLDRPAMLLDEPTSALDRENKERIADLLLNGRERVILSTSHDPFWLNRATHVVEIS